jgi:hypothetical protein
MKEAERKHTCTDNIVQDLLAIEAHLQEVTGTIAERKTVKAALTAEDPV